MRLEDQVTSLELAKRLKELGVLQGGAFDYYENTFHPEHPFIVLRPTVNMMENPTSWICSAFTVAELGEMLPREAHGFDLVIRPADGSTPLKWHIGYVEPDHEGYEYRFERQASDKLVDAMARMLIHLIEQGILKPEERAG